MLIINVCWLEDGEKERGKRERGKEGKERKEGREGRQKEMEGRREGGERGETNPTAWLSCSKAITGICQNCHQMKCLLLLCVCSHIPNCGLDYDGILVP